MTRTQEVVQALMLHETVRPENLGFNPGYASTILSKLQRDGVAERVSRGTYRLNKTASAGRNVTVRRDTSALETVGQLSQTLSALGLSMEEALAFYIANNPDGTRTVEALAAEVLKTVRSAVKAALTVKT